jgi:hypothetical protein
MKSLSLVFLSVLLLACSKHPATQSNPRVFVFTDINIDAGDPDDRQSLIHLLWYADELDIRGIVPDRWNAHGLEACELALKAYSGDYEKLGFGKKGYPAPEIIGSRLAVDRDDAFRLFREAAAEPGGPLYVLVWGNMRNAAEALLRNPELASRIRLITIGTGLMMETGRDYLPGGWKKTELPCEQPNWNGAGREEIFRDERFRDLWWLEINWTYEGMFTGDEPREIFGRLTAFGELGRHMQEVVRNEPWAQYFRVGDTPSVLYVIDPGNDLDDPTKGSWAGQFIKPFPTQRPNYYADDCGAVAWNYADPCATWQNHPEMNRHARGTLEVRRPEMYEALLHKLQQLYRLE